MNDAFSLVAWCLPWRHGGLLRQFVRRQVLARYRGTLLGVTWSLLTPLLMMTVYTLVFRFVFKLRWEGGADTGFDFALRLFAGMTVFGFFSESLLRSPTLILEQPNLIKKVVFPVEIMAWVNCLSGLVFALPGVLLLLLACLVMGVSVAPAWLSLPLIWLPLLPLLLGLGWFFSALGVYVRDVGQVLGLAVTLLQFLSPVFYPLSAVPPLFRSVMMMNPLTPVIEQTRAAIFAGQWPDMGTLFLEFLICGAVAILGAWVFGRLRSGFADVL
jgi:lipopolysaccharide transport system permease protein